MLGECQGRGLVLSRFTRLKKLQLSGWDPARADQLGWRFVLPESLRVLYMDDVQGDIFWVSAQPHVGPEP